MKYVGCSVPERFVNPLFEVFDGGEEFILSSYRDIEKPLAEVGVYFEAGDPRPSLRAALEVVGVTTSLEEREIADEDWKFAYRRHFKTEKVSGRIYTVPEWEYENFVAQGTCQPGEIAIVMDPGMAFGTGKHETTKACLGFIDALADEYRGRSFLDMGSGSGILSIAAAKLGFTPVEGFDVDQEAVDASRDNAGKNGVAVAYRKFALGRPAQPDAVRTASVVVANILGPLLIRFADEIVRYVEDRLILSGILTELYPEVRAAYEARGFRELDRRTIGEWTTGLLFKPLNDSNNTIFPMHETIRLMA